MQQTIFKSLLASCLTLMLLGTAAFLQPAIAGTDSYEIYLNKKLIVKQFVTQPLTLSSLQLNETNSKDVLVVYYNHCGAIGKGRSIAIKDDRGVVLKEWKFTDAAGSDKYSDVTGSDKGMSIPVKDLLALGKNGASLSLFYSSQQLPEGRMLTHVNRGSKPVGFHKSAELPLVAVISRL
jgi:hypothetical protein